jgi:hypothetical protein
MPSRRGAAIPMVNVANKGNMFARAWAAIRKAGFAVVTMPQVFFAAFLMLTVIEISSSWLALREPEKGQISWSKEFLGFFFSVANSFIVTPVLIAVHRFVLLGEVTRNYMTHFFSQRFWHFFCLSVVYDLASFFRVVVRILQPYPSTFLFATMAFIVALTVLSVRLVLIFPAAALDAPGTGWNNALEDSKGAFWSIFRVFVAIFLIVYAPYFALGGLIALIANQSFPSVFDMYPMEVLGTLLSVFSIVVFAVAASWFYLQMGNRLNTAAG